MLHTRWTLLEMRKDALQRGLPAPDEACAKHHCLYQVVEDTVFLFDDLETVARSRQVCIYWLWKHCLLLSILPGGRANTYRHKKILSVECLSRANSWSLSSWVSLQLVHTSCGVRACESQPKRGLLATETWYRVFFRSFYVLLTATSFAMSISDGRVPTPCRGSLGSTSSPCD
jgi:hypothetical protein